MKVLCLVNNNWRSIKIFWSRSILQSSPRWTKSFIKRSSSTWTTWPGIWKRTTTESFSRKRPCRRWRKVSMRLSLYSSIASRSNSRILRSKSRDKRSFMRKQRNSKSSLKKIKIRKEIPQRQLLKFLLFQPKIPKILLIRTRSRQSPLWLMNSTILLPKTSQCMLIMTIFHSPIADQLTISLKS